MDESAILGCHPWMEKCHSKMSSMDGEVSSMEESPSVDVIYELHLQMDTIDDGHGQSTS